MFVSADEKAAQEHQQNGRDGTADSTSCGLQTKGDAAQPPQWRLLRPDCLESSSVGPKVVEEEGETRARGEKSALKLAAV